MPRVVSECVKIKDSKTRKEIMQKKVRPSKKVFTIGITLMLRLADFACTFLYAIASLDFGYVSK